MKSMNPSVWLGILLCVLPAAADAAQFSMRVRSGATARVHVYKSWKTDCTANVGVVRLVSKPAHGKLETMAIDSTIDVSRHDPAKTAHCVGKPIPGFRVEYTSDSNFKGRDSFTVQATWGTKRMEFDNYVVNVE